MAALARIRSDRAVNDASKGGVVVCLIGVGEADGDGAGDGVAEGDGIGVRLGDGNGVGVCLGNGNGVGDCIGDGVGVAEGVRVRDGWPIPSMSSLQRGLRGVQRRRVEGTGATICGSYEGSARAA